MLKKNQQPFLFFLFFLLFASCFTWAGEPENVDPTLTRVSSGFGHRILVYTRCSPEHCWSEVYLQQVSRSLGAAEVLCSAKLNVMTHGLTVTDIQWKAAKGQPQALIQIAGAYDATHREQWRLAPGEQCSYTFLAPETDA